MKLYAAAVWVFAVGAGTCAGEQGTNDFGVICRRFGAARHSLEVQLSTDLNLALPPVSHAFFRAVEVGDWNTASNEYVKIAGTAEYGPQLPEFQNPLWVPVMETTGILDVWDGWNRDTALLKMFYEPVLAAMPTGSVYFGGTDCGRFVITAVNDTQKHPPVYCLTQNALADDVRYMAYLRGVYGKSLWIPSQTDVREAFRMFADEEPGKVDVRSGRVVVSGVGDVMKLNGILCKMIMSHNEKDREFFVEESYVIEWMYPHLEPCGLIMKLNKTALPELPGKVVKQDREFWTEYVGRLLGHPGFETNRTARNAFSKMRCAIAGIYAYRKMYDEAEFAFQQALKIDPQCPESSFRFSKMYEDNGKIGKALGVMVEYISSGSTQSLDMAQARLEGLKAKRELTADETKTAEEAMRQIGATDPQVRAKAVNMLRRIGPPVIPLLRDHSRSDDPEVRVTILDLIRDLERQQSNSATALPYLR